MRLLILIVLLFAIVPDTTDKKKEMKDIKLVPAEMPKKAQPNAKMYEINSKQRVQLIKMDSLLKVKDSLNKIKK